MLFSLVYALAGQLLSLIVVRGRGEASKDVELILLCHEISVLWDPVNPVPCQNPVHRGGAAGQRPSRGFWQGGPSSRRTACSPPTVRAPNTLDPVGASRRSVDHDDDRCCRLSVADDDEHRAPLFHDECH